VIKESVGRVQLCVVPAECPDAHLIGFYRSRFADCIYKSLCQSSEGTAWTKPQPTELPNNNSSIQCIRLSSGNLAMVFNPVSANKPLDLSNISNEDLPSWIIAARAPLCIALSEDNGNSWPHVRELQGKDAMYKKGLAREYSYPSLCQGHDGRIHVVYTYLRLCIKYLAIDEDWIKQNPVK